MRVIKEEMKAGMVMVINELIESKKLSKALEEQKEPEVKMETDAISKEGGQEEKGDVPTQEIPSLNPPKEEEKETKEDDVKEDVTNVRVSY
jgi:hypothetical protein